MINLEEVYNRMLTGDGRVLDPEKHYIVTLATLICQRGSILPEEIKDFEQMIKISNLLYNGGANALLPLSDELYDGLLVIARKQNISYPVGAPPIKFTNLDTIDLLEPSSSDQSAYPKQVVSLVSDKDKMFYYNTLTSNRTAPMYGDYQITTTDEMISRKTRNASHTYNMCGTLDKCKYVLSDDARREGMFGNPTVQIFERDFLGKHINQRMVDPNNISLVVSLKYDGISVEAEVDGDEIVSACTRGDTSNNEASDLTPALSGMKFPRAANISKGEPFGIKFELIVTNYNLHRISQEYGKTYANPRNAVIGLTGGLDARKYRDYLTPIPLESSLNLPRMGELEMLNSYYTRGIDMRSTLIQGTYAEVLYKLKCFVSEAERLRPYMGFQYDGVVVEYTDSYLRQRLGMKNSIPEYAIAIKFPPMRRESIFTHYTYSVGQTGVIVPMAHFQPVEFMGAIHNKTTIHSYKRFRTLMLKPGDKVYLTLNNDVIVYLNKCPDEEQDPNNHNPYEEFPEVCPSCGQPLYQSDSGDSVYCTNFYCKERCIARIANMLKKLNIKDFSTQTMRLLGIYSFVDLMDSRNSDALNKLGPVERENFNAMIKELCSTQYPDYRVLGSIGFTGIAADTWKLICQKFEWEKLIFGDEEEIAQLSKIKGIGPKTVNTIREERRFFSKDLDYVKRYMVIASTFNPNEVTNRPQVRMTGVRDSKLSWAFMSKGFDITDGAVTKDTMILIVPYTGFKSTKVDRAIKLINNRTMAINNGTPINPYSPEARQVYPWIMDLNEANQFIENYNQT